MNRTRFSLDPRRHTSCALRAGQGGTEMGRPLVAPAAELGWLTPEGRQTASAVLVTLTRSGRLLLLVDALPPVRRPVCVRLTAPSLTHWAGASLVASRPTRIGPLLVRLALRQASEAESFRSLAGFSPSCNWS